MIYNYFILSIFVFSIGLLGLLLNRKNIIRILLSIELMLLAVNINIVVSSVEREDVFGWVMAVLVLSLGAAELAIGLAILIVYYRKFSNIDGNNMNRLKG